MVVLRGVRRIDAVERAVVSSGRRRQGGPHSGPPYWEERGWSRSRDQFTGRYLAAGRAFEGRVDGEVFMIRRPPNELRRHEHWPCFHYRGEGWYSIHFTAPPRDVGSGLMSIERILSEALAGRPRPRRRVHTMNARRPEARAVFTGGIMRYLLGLLLEALERHAHRIESR